MSGTIYFIESAGRIKVGFSRNLDRRMKALSTGASHPVTLLASFPGSIKLERAIHSYLHAHRTQWEWFYDCAQVRAAMAELLELGGGAIGFREPEPRRYAKRSAPVYMKDYGEHSRALQKLAEPLVFGDRMKDAIARAAKRADLSYWRAFDIWYGKARRIEVEEIQRIQRAA